ncbi:MAG: hypothetical protein H6591_00905 [Flavobacteriales bacterium]|nr:hypothetical protein [Flavobacteriales bacterium]
MNPIAFIAFLVGINSTPPAPQACPLKEQTFKETAKPASDQAKPKCGRGGWDYN